ncbi:ABC transporter ATP-binding protein [Rhizobium sp. S95]|uniref:ABC transporter ATP-binding protein n=1 Tax=Ciceribacter sichuanensis TaxID=2949647 RepID=A0AAJ1BT78_9HYPH|nr:ABC transporter ATP-binding protein [Ciceribacter sp. S95]MCO5955917.1 ABC transporter ATP-binding protein [Ciceribacter sp. S101]
MPTSLYRFVWRVSGPHQAAIAILSILLFLLGTIPLEIQRRIVNDATSLKPFGAIVTLVSLYLLCVLAEGSVKLALNIYRNWIGERSVRWLRRVVFVSDAADPDSVDVTKEGAELSIVIAEAEPIGGFVGGAISEPLLQAGILLSVTGYLIYLQPLMALVVVLVFCPQIGFVPLMQSAINRRVGAKISVTRQMSAGIVERGAALDADGVQDNRIEQIFALNMGVYKIKFTMNFLMNFLTQLGYAGILALGGYFVVTGQTEVGTIAAFIAGLGKINDPWGDLVDWYRAVKVTQVKYEMVRTAPSLANLSEEDAAAIAF